MSSDDYSIPKQSKVEEIKQLETRVIQLEKSIHQSEKLIQSLVFSLNDERSGTVKSIVNMFGPKTSKLPTMQELVKDSKILREWLSSHESKAGMKDSDQILFKGIIDYEKSGVEIEFDINSIFEKVGEIYTGNRVFYFTEDSMRDSRTVLRILKHLVKFKYLIHNSNIIIFDFHQLDITLDIALELIKLIDVLDSFKLHLRYVDFEREFEPRISDLMKLVILSSNLVELELTYPELFTFDETFSIIKQGNMKKLILDSGLLAHYYRNGNLDAFVETISNRNIEIGLYDLSNTETRKVFAEKMFELYTSGLKSVDTLVVDVFHRHADNIVKWGLNSGWNQVDPELKYDFILELATLLTPPYIIAFWNRESNQKEKPLISFLRMKLYLTMLNWLETILQHESSGKSKPLGITQSLIQYVKSQDMKLNILLFGPRFVNKYHEFIPGPPTLDDIDEFFKKDMIEYESMITRIEEALMK